MPHLQEVQTDGCSHPGRVKQMPFLSRSGQWYGPRHCYLCHACDVQTIHHFKISQSSICIYISIYIYIYSKHPHLSISVYELSSTQHRNVNFFIGFLCLCAVGHRPLFILASIGTTTRNCHTAIIEGRRSCLQLSWGSQCTLFDM